MQLSIITDEISQDLLHALRVCRDLQVKTLELRTIDGENIVFHSEERLARIQALLEEGGFRVCSIASPFLKSPLWQDDARGSDQEREWWILQRSFELAKRFNAPLVRAFSLYSAWRSGMASCEAKSP
ncbi:TIM barrel protein [Ktedonobacter racemifer]|uniref:Xylose isomerase domain protein TIM barrel n=1 Tax=Ktedonobacter racemifer DSM 44963 TaxID=485913 RepID=D6TWW6_KTERA|nr:TIM barrel protein [Ktedonobacter racemifer]EFH84699.1 xylose isomerase domain protein TIM barrel [Ktedonobacter racemifer DSM 44963]